MDRDEHLALLEPDIAAFAAAVATGPADATIAGCPGWTLVDLARHLGEVHRWALEAVLTGQRPVLDVAADPAPADPTALADWVRAGGSRLLDALRDLDPEAPTWHPFPAPRVAGLWPRRQAQEASVHRWDAENAIGQATSIDAELAADGVDEYFTAMLPRLISREKLAAPTSVLGVSAVDTGHQWVVGVRDGRLEVLADAEPEAELAGIAEHVLLRLWGRAVPDGAIVVSGVPAVAAEWLALGGA